MNPMKRVGLTVLLLMLGAILATPPAVAAKPGKSVTGALVPPKIDPPEPEARGKYTLQDWGELAALTVTCRNLTPMKQYLIVGESWSGWGGIAWSYPVSADATGNVSAELSTWGRIMYLWVENDDGQIVLVER